VQNFKYNGGMRKWRLKPGDPLCLTLATDARLEPTDYYNDQTWQLSLGGGTPPALAFQTTYGLRARSMRMFPCFTEGEETRMDPEEFTDPPIIEQIYPNFLQVRFMPFPEIDVQAAYWVPQSQAVAGRLSVSNRSKATRQIQLDWVGQLSAIDEGQRLAAVEMQAASVLSGRTGDLAPVVFLTGGPKAGSGSYPSLRLNSELQPGETRWYTWTQAALSDPEASFALARSLAAQKWEAEHSRLEMANASLVEVFTGIPDWDIAFMMAQREAFSLFVGPTASLPHPSFVQNRLPDQGYSLRGDGSDYNHLWNGQSPLESYYLSNLILPVAPDLAKGLIYNFLHVQDEWGFIDWKPGLGGQRSRLLATPVLATLAWRIYEASEDRDFLERTFSGLHKFIYHWLTPEHDQDRDGIPELDHPMQIGAEDHPLYSYWYEWAQGVDISTMESPVLIAFLYQECQSLIKIATLLRRAETIPALRSLAEQLKEAAEATWSESASAYQNRDRDSHYSLEEELLAQNSGQGMILIQREFEQPVRLLIHLHTSQANKPYPQIFIHGTSISGQHRIEKIGGEQFKWYSGRGVLTGQNVYRTIEQIDVQGLEAGDETAIYSVGHTFMDHSVLAPLWARIPDASRAEKLVENTITNPDRFWRPFGIPACPHPPENADPQFCNNAHLIWNQLIGEGLVAYGYREQAAQLLERIMNAILTNLKQEGAYRRYYDSDNGKGNGERNMLSGLPPLGLFLETLGIGLISPHKVALEGYNPFPWAVTVKYRGLTIVRQREKSIVIFPDGQTVNIEDSKPRIVSLE
jgi:hypothetical protein